MHPNPISIRDSKINHNPHLTWPNSNSQQLKPPSDLFDKAHNTFTKCPFAWRYCDVIYTATCGQRWLATSYPYSSFGSTIARACPYSIHFDMNNTSSVPHKSRSQTADFLVYSLSAAYCLFLSLSATILPSLALDITSFTTIFNCQTIVYIRTPYYRSPKS